MTRTQSLGIEVVTYELHYLFFEKLDLMRLGSIPDLDNRIVKAGEIWVLNLQLAGAVH